MIMRVFDGGDGGTRGGIVDRSIDMGADVDVRFVLGVDLGECGGEAAC